jgi:periplasmic divalent cation tolerance protein
MSRGAIREGRRDLSFTSSAQRTDRIVPTDIVIVFTTLGADADATVFAHTLVEERLAACVNVLPPMISVYRWKGRVEQDREQQLIIKTTSASLGRLQARVRELHPYEVPEFLVLPAVGGSDSYLTWVQESVG